VKTFCLNFNPYWRPRGVCISSNGLEILECISLKQSKLGVHSFYLFIHFFFFSGVNPCLGLRRAAYAKLEASCTTMNQSNLM
jgi:hypothetical protein